MARIPSDDADHGSLLSRFSFAKSGRFLAVAAVHVVLIYAVATSLGIIKVPNLIKPMDAVMIDIPNKADNWKPPVRRPNLEQPKIDIPVTNPVPEVPVEVAPSDALSANTSEPIESASDLQVRSRIEPVYSAVSRRANEQGSGLFRVLVDTTGLPSEVQIVKSTGYARLDQSAVDAIKRWKFAPAMQGSTAVRAWTSVKVTFRLNG